MANDWKFLNLIIGVRACHSYIDYFLVLQLLNNLNVDLRSTLSKANDVCGLCFNKELPPISSVGDYYERVRSCVGTSVGGSFPKLTLPRPECRICEM
jgi:hypothetical protein